VVSAVAPWAEWRYLSRYAHGLLWNALPNQTVLSGEPDPETGQITTKQSPDPEVLLNHAFSRVVIIEKATTRLADLCRV
jgi:hypothetical protein